MIQENEIPHFLYEMLLSQYGDDVTKKIIQGYKNNRLTTLRINTIKAKTEEIQQVFINNNIQFEKVPWYEHAYIIKNVTEKEIQNLEIYKQGKIYLQSLSSMIPPLVLNPKQGTDILDMAAAPGGKTTQIAAITDNKANITACEMNQIRAERLKFNLEKQGATSVYVMTKDARTIDDFFSFDQILLDAPCSGSGIINVNDKNINEVFTQKLLQKTINSQRKLIQKAINVLKVGGEMVYSTCSILEQENENIIEEALKTKRVQIVPIEACQELPTLPSKINGTITICPNELYEGFFIAKLVKIY